jgi:hypothetical protein
LYERQFRTTPDDEDLTAVGANSTRLGISAGLIRPHLGTAGER